MTGEGTISRRDFLVIGGKLLQASALAAGASAVEPYFSSEANHGEKVGLREIINHDYLSCIERSWDRLRTVSKKYHEAQSSQDQEKILDAKKLVILMVFTEAASRLGIATKEELNKFDVSSLIKAPGGSEYPFSSTLLFHYLNGNGEKIDISSELTDKMKNNEAFFTSYLNEAMFWLAYQNQSKHSSDRQDYSLNDFRQFRNQVMQGNGIQSQYYSEDGTDYFYGLGGHGSRMVAEDARWRQTDSWKRGERDVAKYDFLLANPTVMISDHYKYRLDADIDLSWFATSFLKGLAPKDLEASAQKIVSDIHKTKLIPENIKAGMIDIIYNISEFHWSRDLIGLVVGDIVLKEKDMALLETEFGARPFDVEGTAKYYGEVVGEFTVQ